MAKIAAQDNAIAIYHAGQHTATTILKLPENYGNFSTWLFLAIQILLKVIINLKSEVANLLEKINRLEEENRNLYEQANLGSDTSGIPPGKDWRRQNGAFNKSKDTIDSEGTQTDKPHREKPISITGYLKNRGNAKRRPGGQAGHAPSCMRTTGFQERDPVMHYPGICISCLDFEQCKEEGRFRKYTTSHGFDIEVVLVRREHWQFEAANCLHDGARIHENFPEVIGAAYYDINIQLHVLTWHHLFYGSYDRIDLAAKELFGLSLNAGTANAIVKRASTKILASGFMDALRFYILLFEKTLGVDETSAFAGGRNAWVHTASTTSVTLLTVHWRRGYEGAIYSGVLQFYINTLISDCWSAYFNEKLKCRHSICNGHILRELVAAAYFRSQDWAIEMFDLLLEIFENKRDLIERGVKAFQSAYIDDIHMRYKQILAKGFSGQKETKGKTFSLLERLQKLESAVLAFAAEFDVVFTNNVSEVSLRNLKVALHVAGQFKTMAGLGDYCIIQSFMDTCRKQGRNPFEMLKVLMSGGDIINAVFDAGKSAVLKQMLTVINAVSNVGADEIDETIRSLGLHDIPEEIRAAVLYGFYRVCDIPPPEKKNSAVPKDKMQEARKQKELKEWSRKKQAEQMAALNAKAGSG